MSSSSKVVIVKALMTKLMRQKRVTRDERPKVTMTKQVMITLAYWFKRSLMFNC